MYVPLILEKFSDPRGLLNILEINDQITFETKRIYYLSNIEKNAVRGAHAHKKLSQIFLCVNGSFDLCIDDGKNRIIRSLSRDSCAIFVPKGKWRELINFTEDAICLVLADRKYEPEDYIHSYNEFKNWTQSEQ